MLAPVTPAPRIRMSVVRIAGISLWSGGRPRPPQHLVQVLFRARDDGTPLRLTEEKGDGIEPIIAELDVASDSVHRRLRQRNGQAAVRQIVRAANELVRMQR